jgi:catechol 2,3-dioxygenase-like lactoylglutathione lyase family enzyme
MKPAFTHCALHVRDLDQSIAFYRSFCGLELVEEHGRARAAPCGWQVRAKGTISFWCCSAAERCASKTKTT